MKRKSSSQCVCFNLRVLIHLSILLASALLASIATAQEVWVARYKGVVGGWDGAYAIAVDGSGNVYVTGKSVRTSGDYDYATIKYNASGAQQWVTRYNGPGDSDDGAYAVAVDGSGNVYVTGYSLGSGTIFDYATIKYNASGAQQWVARYDGTGNGNDYAYAIAVDGSGNVYVTGGSAGMGGVGCINFICDDYATIKYDTAGTQQWVARYNGPGNSSDNAVAIAVDGASNVYVTGTSGGSGGGWRLRDDQVQCVRHTTVGCPL